MARALGRPADRRLLPGGRLAGPMPWMIAIMTLLTVLAAAAGLGLGGAANALGHDLADQVTVQLVEANPDVRNKAAAAIVAELARVPNVLNATRVSDEEIRSLLAPWLGDMGPGEQGLGGDDLPMPALIDVSLHSATDADVDQVSIIVHRIAPGGRIDRHAQWLGPLAGLIAALGWLAVGLVALMGAATAAAVMLGARSALEVHRDTIDVMHLMGASDLQIARLFERRAAMDALFGAVLGAVPAIALVLVLGWQLNAVGAALIDAGGLGGSDWVLLAVIPLLVVGLAVMTARVTVVRALRLLL